MPDSIYLFKLAMLKSLSMKKLSTAAVLFSAALFMSCSLPSDKAVFTGFSYRGLDSRFEKVMDPSCRYLNPVLSGFYPDPSICRKGEDYFLVNSTFSYFPGVPIFHSRDLVNWKQIGHVLDRPSQLQLGGIRIDGGVYAPAISYNPHNGMFYMVNTIVDGIGNFYVKTEDPFKGEWSDPILLPRVNGIDPSFLFDDDGKAYVVYNGDCPGEPQWNGHRAIWMYEFDYENDTVTGDKVLLVDGGVNPADRPVWIEGPHLYNVDGKYILMCAEGGTGTNHSEVVFTSDSPSGPFRPHRINPVLTQRNLPEDREEKVTSAGHADLIQTHDGEWWAVFLACRPYAGDMYNTGRETFMLPVTWDEGIPVILPSGEPVPTVVEKKGLANGRDMPLTGNFEWTDRFDSLGFRWVQLRTPECVWWEVNDGLCITPREVTIYDKGANPSFMAVRQQHSRFEAETYMKYRPSDGGFAGLVVFQNESCNYALGKRLIGGVTHVALYKADKEHGPQMVASAPLGRSASHLPLGLKVMADGDEYAFFYSEGESGEWKPIGDIQDGRILSTWYAGGFTGTMIGCYATSALAD